MKRSEAIAKCLFEYLVPGTIARFRERQQSAPDFDLISEDALVGVMEVVTSTSPVHMQTVAEIRNPRRGGHFVVAKLCEKDWMVWVRSGAKIRSVRAHIDGRLRAAELEGRETFNSEFDCHDSQAVSDLLGLGIDSGYVTKWKHPGRIGISPAGVETIVCGENLTRSVRTVASMKDNRAKLSTYADVERHLFVFVDRYDYDAWVPVVDSDLPDSPVDLPQEVSIAWATAARGDTYFVWRAPASERWSVLGSFKMSEEELRMAAGGGLADTHQ